MPSPLVRSVRGAIVAVALAVAAPATGAASPSGAYLAAHQADRVNDYVAAADYYERALAADPENLELLQDSLVVETAAGDVAAARALADRVALQEPDNQLAALVRLADMLSAAEYDAAAELLDAVGDGTNPLLQGLVSGWIEVGREDFAAAQAAFDAMDTNGALGAFGQLHKALALAYAGDFVSAANILAGDEANGPLHLNRTSLLAHAQVLAQLDREDEALAMLDEALSSGIPDAALSALRDRLAGGEEIAFTRIADARNGAADAYLTLAQALDDAPSQRVALVHARLAAHIWPELIEAHLLAAELLELEGQFALATEALGRVTSDSPWFVTAEIRRANTQRESGDPEAGIATLAALADSASADIEVHSALGDALRSAERYDEAAAAYEDALALIEEPQPAHWVIYYTAAIANERAGNWDDAEAQFRRALELEPGQPLVLNYLGYSMVEQRRNLDEALEMIEQAVEAQPDDGYITDSLGWVLYRLGRYEEAVEPMERAVELTPDDPIINDHLGDVLWMVGRKREAEFQWRRALSFGPAEDLDMDRVRQKLEVGLDKVLAEERAESGIESETDG